MKYIVVYMIIFLGITPMKSAGQKPNIDLLPTAGNSMHPEALIDTSILCDTLFVLDSFPVESDSVSGEGSGLIHSRESSLSIGKRKVNTGSMIKLGLYPLFFKKINPLSYIIYLTALKI